MKNFRIILTVVAFVLAIGLTFITKADNNQLKYGNFVKGCALGKVNETNCGTTVTAFGRCTVSGGVETVVAYNDTFFGFCIEPCYKQTP